MNVYISNDPIFFNEIKYTLNLLFFNKGIKPNFSTRENADLIVEDSESADIRISRQFYELLSSSKTSHDNYFKSNCEFLDSRGFTDYLSSAFYLINVIQEMNDTDDDQFGRYKYSNSLQKKFGNVRINIVQKLFDALWFNTPKLKSIPAKSIRSRIYLSHDIDTIHGSLIQDSFYYLKKLQPFQMAGTFIRNVLDKPSWLNMDKIMKMESDKDFTSTFFWLVNKGDTGYGLRNSDYRIKGRKISKTIKEIGNSSWGNGLHKSASVETFSEEMSKLPVNVPANRYHYIRFKPHKDYEKIEKAGIELDASLGFADTPGFRNGYGLPFLPYNFQENRPFRFVEVPLNIMDTTYFNYLKFSASEFENDVKSFVESNSSNTIVSVLFHNNFISDGKYGNYFKVFKNLLSYFYESGFKSISQREIIATYKNEYQDQINA
jgi:hypothetical protein